MGKLTVVRSGAYIFELISMGKQCTIEILAIQAKASDGRRTFWFLNRRVWRTLQAFSASRRHIVFITADTKRGSAVEYPHVFSRAVIGRIIKPLFHLLPNETIRQHLVRFEF